MGKFSLVLLASILACASARNTFFESAAEASPLVSSDTISSRFADLVVHAGLKCGLVDGQLVCGTKKSGAKDNDNDADDKPKKKKATGNVCAGNNHCGAGFTDLETPNNYGACCEAAGASKSAPKEAEKCKFPGEIGTPPNCQCPEDTEFKGYKGCLKYKQANWCKKAYVASVDNQLLSRKCREEYSHGNPECHKSDDPLYLECCCNYRDF